MSDLVLKHPQQLAPLLRALRAQAGLSQAQLAGRLGVTAQAISRLEQRPEGASVERLMRVLAALKFELVLRPRAAGPASAEW